ncbi:polysaccharide deacetylase family protein [Winogradskya humida]|uniref:NodB homology domain-containing protein n=1 Tax=Winogradskya humida TaxID=113566 RepID=A0ABQ3ZEM3_9ACTN|nr:polysaccharide deacetylase family protein [Actinoplanes humidus]GIE17010.1 hypothetical protein Ahu01nite_001120 [Actinoplanes humidus]
MNGAVVPVLLYHSVSDSPQARADPWAVRVRDFREDMEQVVASGRRPLTAREFAGYLHREEPPADPVVLVTFDDGFADYLDVVTPIVADLGIMTTLFVTTGYIGAEGMLSRRGVQEVGAAGTTEVGAHSVTHPHLDVVNGTRCRDEIRRSKESLEDLLGEAVPSFAYPHGSHRAAVKAQVAAAGFATAHAVKNRLSHTSDDVLAIARFTVQGRSSRADVAAVTRGTGRPIAGPDQSMATRVFRVVRGVRHRIAGG